jgi:tetratricopeptide (TPR) repeat protein
MEPPLSPPELLAEEKQGASVFFSYAHRDKAFRDRLEEHLSNLKYRGLITTWYDREIGAGEEWAQEIEIHLNKAQVILLLISASFMASDYCYSIEMRRALERYERHEAEVIPILLRPVLYTDAPFAKLQMLPTNGKPIVLWRDRDSAFVDIAYAIEKVAKKYVLQAQTKIRPSTEQLPSGSYIAAQIVPPSLNPNSLQPGAQVGLPPMPSHRRRLSPLLVGLVGLGICVLSSISLVLISAIHNGGNVIPTPIPTATTISSPTPSFPTPTPTPSPIIPISGTISLIIIIGILLLAAIFAGFMVVRSIRAKNEQKRAQETTEEARKRKYFEDAIAAYQNALAQDPQNVEALRGMGNALFALEKYDQALDAFTQANESKPTPATYAGLGDALAKLKRYNEAIDAYQEAIQLDATVTMNYDDYVQALRALGRNEEAEQVHASTRQLGYDDQE